MPLYPWYIHVRKPQLCILRKTIWINANFKVSKANVIPFKEAKVAW